MAELDELLALMDRYIDPETAHEVTDIDDVMKRASDAIRELREDLNVAYCDLHAAESRINELCGEVNEAKGDMGYAPL